MTIRFWDPQTGKAVDSPICDLDEVVHCLGFSRDGRWLAAGSNYTRIWDLATKQPTHFVARNQFITTSLAFSPDGSTMVLANRFGIQFLGSTERKRASSHIVCQPPKLDPVGCIFSGWKNPCLRLHRWRRSNLGCDRYRRVRSSATTGTQWQSYVSGSFL